MEDLNIGILAGLAVTSAAFEALGEHVKSALRKPGITEDELKKCVTAILRASVEIMPIGAK